jgi:hypothetical protein
VHLRVLRGRFFVAVGAYLERIHQMRKYVFSSTLTADWNNATIVRGDPVAAM